MRYKPQISRLSGMQLLTVAIAMLFVSHTVLADVGPNWIEQWGITWTFDKNITTDGSEDTYQYGTFANGDYWVIGPANIIGIDPPSTTAVQRNGSMVNPVSADAQSYDSRSAGYNAGKNAALDVDSENPLEIKVASSIISCISLPERSAKLWIDRAAALTILLDVPPADAFRPPYSGSDKTIRATGSDIDRTKLSNLPKPVGALSYVDLVTAIQMDQGPWIIHWASWWSTYIHPIKNMNWYGTGYAHRTGQAALALNLAYTPAEKEPILINFLQLGIDTYGVIEAGDIANWENNGGIQHGRKIPILFAATVFNDAGMKAMFEKTGDYISEGVDADGYPDPTGPGKPPADYIYFQEDDQTHYITQYDYDLTNNLVPGTPWNPDSRIEQFPYLEEHIGLPGWGIRHATQPERNASQLGTNYRSLNAVTYPAMALAVHMMGMKEHWNHDALFDYTDRWMEWTGGGIGGTPAWVWNAWFDYRDDFPPVWPNQSGNQRPTANAGPDPDDTITDIDGDGIEQVSLDGSASTDDDGDIASWVWADNLGDPIPDGEVVAATLSVGEHIITLTVIDNAGDSDTDTVAVTIENPDTTPPDIVSVTVNSPVQILFSEPLDEASATNVSNYVIEPDITIYSATLEDDLRTVILITSDHSENVEYTLTVNGVMDVAGNPTSEETGNYQYDSGLLYSTTTPSTFNGIDSFVQIPTSGMSVDGGTIVLNAYAEDLSVSRYLFGHTIGSWSNRIQLYIRDGSLGLGLGDTNSKHTDITSLQPLHWYHIALTWNGSLYAVYVGGSESATGSYSGLTQLNDFADIGNTGNPSFRDQEAFSGVIDNVRIYNRALTDTEIQQLSHTITASAQAGGSITPNGTLLLADGVDQTFTITPQTGYHIADVLVDGGSVGAVGSYTFANITSDHTISATFALTQVTHTIQASAGKGGSISPNGTTTINQGQSQTFTIAPAIGYRITDVLVDGGSVGAVGSYTFTNITGDHTISATFALTQITHTIQASAGTGGSISPNGTTTVNQGQSQQFTIAPATNYRITDVLVDGGSVGAVGSYTFANITGNHTISATFALTPVTHTIQASAGTGGSISPNGTTTINQGQSQTFTIAPATGYRITDVLVDGGSVGAVGSYTFANITGDHTISATFSLDTYTIAATAGAGATVSPGGNIEVQHGSSQAFTITAQAGYHITDVMVDGQSMGAIGSCTFTNITQSHTLAANAAANQNDIAPVAWYKFDEGYGNSAQDSSGIGNTGALVGAAWTTEDGLSFNGTDDYVEVPDSDSLDIQNEITLSLWVKLNTYDTDWPKLIVKPYQSAAEPWELYTLDLGHYGSTPRLIITDGISGGDTAVAANSGYTISLNEWHHIAGTYDGSLMSVYVDGNLIATQTADFQIGTNDMPLSIGGRLGVNSFNGFIDEVQIYNRSLTGQEVIELYKQNTLKGRYKLDTYSGLNAPDSSENDNTATLANGPSWTGAGELELDGIDDYVDCGSGASSNLTGDLTVTAWVYPDSFGAGPLAGGLGRIVDRHGDVSGFAFYVKEEIQGIAYLTYGGDFINSDSDVIDLAQWQHVAVTYSDASDTVTFYVNGQPAGGGNYQTNPNDSANAPLIIGNRATSDRGFEGMLSDVRIYSRTLADDEISTIYRTYEFIEAKNLCFEVSTTDSDDYVAQNPMALPAGATFTDNIFTWRTWYNQAGSYEITFEVPGQPDYTQSVPMVVENVSLKPWYRNFLEMNDKY